MPLECTTSGFRRFDDSGGRNGDEDKGCARKGCLPRSRARPADLAASILRTVGSSNVAAATEGSLCHCGADHRLDDPRAFVSPRHVSPRPANAPPQMLGWNR